MLITQCSVSLANDSLDLNKSLQPSVSLTNYLGILEDASQQLSLADVQNAQFKTDFPKQESINLSFTSSAYWLRLIIDNSSDQPQEKIIELDYPLLKYVDEYIKGHQRMAIFITRFLGSASTVVNFLAGLTPVPFKTFILYDALGNFLSITFIVFLGFFISESWQSVASIIGVTSTIISVFVLFMLVIIVIKKFGKLKYQE